MTGDNGGRRWFAAYLDSGEMIVQWGGYRANLATWRDHLIWYKLTGLHPFVWLDGPVIAIAAAEDLMKTLN